MTAAQFEAAAAQPVRAPATSYPSGALGRLANQKLPIAVRFDPQTIHDVKQAAMRSNRSFASAIRLLVQFAIEAQARRISLLPNEPTAASIREGLGELNVAELHDLRRAIDGEIAIRSREAHDQIIRRISEIAVEPRRSPSAATA